MREVELAVVGAGVAGLTAAAEAAKRGVQVLVIERMGAGGQVMNVENILNMPGYPEGVSGFELGPLLQERAEAAGVEFMLGTVERITSAGGTGARHVLHCDDGEAIAARAVLIAAGSRRRRLGVPGEEALQGRGVSHCASCDGPLFRGQPVCVVGGGDSAFGEAAVLAAHAGKVTVVLREAAPHAQQFLVDALSALPNVQLLAATEVVDITGDAGVTGVLLATEGAAPRALPAEGVFVYAGLQADTAFLGNTVRLDAEGRIETDDAFATSVAGIFAAGDVRAGAAYLLSAAAADGAAAAHAATHYLRTP